MRARKSTRFNVYRLVLFLLVPCALGGCVDPVTQLRCEFLAHDAIHAVQKGNTDELANVLSNPEQATATMDQLAGIMPDGAIWCRGDFYLFPTPFYNRYYTVYPKSIPAPADRQPLYLHIRYHDDPLRIVSISPDEDTRK